MVEGEDFVLFVRTMFLSPDPMHKKRGIEFAYAFNCDVYLA